MVFIVLSRYWYPTKWYIQYGVVSLTYSLTPGCDCNETIVSLPRTLRLYWLLHFQQFCESKLSTKSNVLISYNIQSFPSIYSHNPDLTAFLLVWSLGFLPHNIGYTWANENFDGDFHNAAWSSHQCQSVIRCCDVWGQSSEGVTLYPNYAIMIPLWRIFMGATFWGYVHSNRRWTRTMLSSRRRFEILKPAFRRPFVLCTLPIPSWVALRLYILYSFYE